MKQGLTLLQKPQKQGSRNL